MKCLQNSVDLFFIIEAPPFEGVCQFFHHIASFLILGRNAHQATIFDESCHYASAFVAFRRQWITGKEQSGDMLCAFCKMLYTITIQFVIVVVILSPDSHKTCHY